MELGLHVRTVEVIAIEIVVWTRKGGEFKLIPEIGAEVYYVVNVKAGVDVNECCSNVVAGGVRRLLKVLLRRGIQKSATWLACTWGRRDWSIRRELVRVFVEVIGEATLICAGCDIRDERFVQVKNVVVFKKSGDDRSYLCQSQDTIPRSEYLQCIITSS